MSYSRSRNTTYRPSRPRANRNGNVCERSLRVEKNHIGYLIGPKGSVIKGIQQKYGIRSRIDQNKKIYMLSGEERNVMGALKEIQQHIAWINNVSRKREQGMTEEEQHEEGGWKSTGSSKRRQPRRVVEKSTVSSRKTENPFAGLEEDSDDDCEMNNDAKYCGDVPTVVEVSKPTGCWAQGVTSSVKEEGKMRMSRGMLEQRLLEATNELEKAQKKLENDKNANTNCSWADQADIEDSEDEVEYWKEVVEDLERAIRSC